MSKDKDIKKEAVTEEELYQEEIKKLTAMSISIHKDQPTHIIAKGVKFKIKYPKRIVYDKIVTIGLKVNNKGEVLKMKDRNADVKVAAYILLHNPILIFLFARIYVLYLKCRYDSEIYAAIIEAGINPRDIEAFYKSSISIMSLAQSKMAMLQL